MQEAKISSSSKKQQASRRVETHQFGLINVKPKHIFMFPEGIFGFEDLREFILISQKETEPLKWLLSIDQPSIGFPVLNPLLLDISYQVSKSALTSSAVAVVIVTISNAEGKMTANMKAPIILDIDQQQGKQIIMTSDRYSPEYVIAGTGREAN